MAVSLNKVMLIGHLGDEVKMHFFEGGNSIGRFPIATNESYTNKATGEKVTTTEWHNIVVRNRFAEVCEKYLSKGDLVYVEGRIKTRQWEDDNGNKRYSTEIQATDVQFINTKKGASNNSESNTSTDKQTTTPTKPTVEDDDLPF
jgi:single-strand DNA-binding protein